MNTEEGRTTQAVRSSAYNSLSIADPDVLNGPICYELLSIPVYQFGCRSRVRSSNPFSKKNECENGHVLCSFCLIRLLPKKNQCPSCRSPVGTNRNIAIEKVLQSVTLLTCRNAKYGCEETTLLTLEKKHHHEKTCGHSPCSCPLSDCNFLGSSTQLYQHLFAQHSNSAVVLQFQYDKYFKVKLNATQEFLVLQEEKDNSLLFVLQNRIEQRGRSLSIHCISTRYVRKQYKIRANWGASCAIKMRSIARSSKRWRDYDDLGYLTVPSLVYDNEEKIDLDIYLYKDSLPNCDHPEWSF
ncbi:E3 ubiquitin-protein ligase [Melia azedarach]|uniref:E3 ubiquitin-protein ligase n=1 Tax=Melia azedarach TaxID=155640 RepID=A0ACC1X5R3_MELAZ|nr:E3 ubiquitin-protein ligase [Melia azedarach]